MASAPAFRPQEVRIGASWYPEMWPESTWQADADRMAELGFTMVRLFEFAWHRFEPQAGCYDFAWARRVMDLMHERGIRVMIGTPTAAPPAWLSSAHPEILRTKPDGTRAGHGQRKHYNQHSACYLQHCARIVGKMVEAFADHPALDSWQIDNEMSGFDYGEETRQAFHRWLEQRFTSVQAMNEAWGLEFWSQAYQSFDQVPLCVASIGSIEVPERHHPSLLLAIAEFQNLAWRRFICNQRDIIRAAGDWPITTNKTGWLGGGMQWDELFQDLDCVGASIYADLSYYHNNLGRFDSMRGLKPGTPYQLLETAPNWSGGGPIWNIHHEPRGVEVMSWMSTLMGGCSTIFWQWRSHWAGQEMQHGTHVSQTGKWMPGKEAWQRLARDYRQHGPWLMQHPPRQADLGIMTSTLSAWVFSIDPIHSDNRYEERLRNDYYLPLVRRHIWRDLVPLHADLSPYKVLILPHLPILPQATREALRSWVQNGGRLLLGPLTGTRREDMTTWTEQEFGGLEELMGGESSLRFTPHWVEDSIEVLFDNDRSSATRIWCEGFEATTAEVRATYHGGWGHGHAAVLDNRYGKGRVITLGCPLDEDAYCAMVEELCADVGIGPVADGGQRIVVIPRNDPQGHTVAYAVINYGKEEDRVTLISGGYDVLHQENVDNECVMPPLSVRLVCLTSDHS